MPNSPNVLLILVDQLSQYNPRRHRAMSLETTYETAGGNSAISDERNSSHQR